MIPNSTNNTVNRGFQSLKLVYILFSSSEEKGQFSCPPGHNLSSLIVESVYAIRIHSIECLKVTVV